jgi:hypothetical protein
MLKDSEKNQAGEASGTGKTDIQNAQEAWIESVSSAIRSVRSIYDVATVLDRISDETGRIRGSGRPSMQDRQRAKLFLTHMELVMNDLERIETQEHGASRESAGRFAEFEGRIRSIRDELDRL